MSDTFSYNSISLQNPLVDTIDGSAVYDDGDVSVVFTKIVYRVRGTIIGSSSADFYSQLQGAKAALMVPRQALQVTMGGVNLYNSSSDFRAGPTPRRVNFSEIAGATFCVVTFEIEVCVQEKTGTIQAVLSNSWTIEHVIDELCYVTRTLHGKFRINPLWNNNQNLLAANANTSPTRNPDNMRALVTPTIPAGFRRIQMDFLRSADGLEMTYTIVDKELYRAPPTTCVKASGTFGHEINSYVYFNHMTLEFQGNRTQDKTLMWLDMVKVAMSKFNFGTSDALLVNSTLEEDLYENTVRWHITTRCASLVKTTGGMPPIFPSDTKIFLIDNSTNPQNIVTNLGPYGSAQLYAMLAFGSNTAGSAPIFFDPTVETTIRLGTQQNGQGTLTAQANVAMNSSVVPGSASGILSPAQVVGGQPYVHYEDYIEYEQQNGCTLLPSTRSGSFAKNYQWHVPYQIIRQHGCALRENGPVTVPGPFQVVNGVLAYKRITPIAPRPNPDGTTYQFGATWEYVILAPSGNAPNPTPQGQFVDMAQQVAMGYESPYNLATNFDPTVVAQKVPYPTAPIVITSHV